VCRSLTDNEIAASHGREQIWAHARRSFHTPESFEAAHARRRRAIPSAHSQREAAWLPAAAERVLAFTVGRRVAFASDRRRIVDTADRLAAGLGWERVCPVGLPRTP